MEIVSTKHDGKELSVVDSGYRTEVVSYSAKRSDKGAFNLSGSIAEYIFDNTSWREFSDDEDENYYTKWVDVVSITPLPQHHYDDENYNCIVVYKVSYRIEKESASDRFERTRAERIKGVKE